MASQLYDFRHHAHDRQLPAHQGHLFDCNFITQCCIKTYTESSHMYHVYIIHCVYNMIHSILLFHLHFVGCHNKAYGNDNDDMIAVTICSCGFATPSNTSSDWGWSWFENIRALPYGCNSCHTSVTGTSFASKSNPDYPIDDCARRHLSMSSWNCCRRVSLVVGGQLFRCSAIVLRLYSCCSEANVCIIKWKLDVYRFYSSLRVVCIDPGLSRPVL